MEESEFQEPSIGEEELQIDRLYKELDALPSDNPRASILLKETVFIDEHPEWYENACLCILCRSYG